MDYPGSIFLIVLFLLSILLMFGCDIIKQDPNELGYARLKTNQLIEKSSTMDIEAMVFVNDEMLRKSVVTVKNINTGETKQYKYDKNGHAYIPLQKGYYEVISNVSGNVYVSEN
jgi:hypothetical protein